MKRNPFRAETQSHWIFERFLEGKNREEIFREMYPLVMGQIEPLVFSKNVNGRRIPISPIHDQLPLAFYRIGFTRDEVVRKYPDYARFLPGETSIQRRNYATKSWRAQFYNQVRRDIESLNVPAVQNNDPEPDPESEIAEPQTPEFANGNHEFKTLKDKLEYLYKRLVELRQFVQSKKVGGREFDYISTRAFVYGRNAVIQGIEPDDFLWSIGASWSEDVKSAAGLAYAPNYGKYAVPGTPRLLGFVVRLIKAGIPVYLCGPTGSGKSVLARHVAEYLEKEYAEIPLSLGVSRTDLFGSWNVKGYISRPFVELYENGGLFNFEEIDAADSNILLSVNNAIANESLFNSVTGEEIEKHDDFGAIATANTWGSGATANYGGREGLDGSTLDRFKYGRVFVDYDSEIESQIMFADLDSAEKTYRKCAVK